MPVSQVMVMLFMVLVVWLIWLVDGQEIKRCGNDVALEHKLVKLIVDRVYVNEGQVVPMRLKADYHIVLGQNGKGTTSMEIVPYVSEWALRDSNP
ncbi:MAG: hypothetical protein ABI947_23325 [Chloroflexota bacterium]